MRPTCYVLVRDYPSEGGHTIVRVYTSKARAEEDKEMAAESSNQRWMVHEVPLFDGEPEP